MRALVARPGTDAGAIMVSAAGGRAGSYGSAHERTASTPARIGGQSASSDLFTVTQSPEIRTLVTPGVNNYSPQSFDYAATPTAERIETARQLLAEAGFTRDKPLRFELRYNAGEVHTKVAVAVSSMWKEALGVEARLAAVEFKSLFDAIDRREVDMYRLSWVGDYNDPYTFLQYLKGGFGINLPRYASAEYDALLDEASQQTDPARRRVLLEQAERTMLADHPLIPLYFYVNKHLVKPSLLGWYDNVMNVVYSQDLALAPTGTSPGF
jgi:oligopeptide transport system substrate-binding protein